MNRTKELHQEVEAVKEQAREVAEKWHHRALNGTKTAARTTDQYVHDNPWTSLAIVAAVGCMIGWVIGRARRGL